MLLPAKLPQGLISQLATSCNISWRLTQDWGEMVSYHLPFHWGASPGPLGGDPTMHQQTAWSGGGFILESWGVWASDAQWNSVRHKNQQGEGNTSHQTSKSPGSNSGLLRRQKGTLITSQRLLATMVKLCLSGLGNRFSLTVCETVWKCEPETHPSCKESEESLYSGPWQTLKVKGEPLQGLQSGVYTDSLGPKRCLNPRKGRGRKQMKWLLF
jgi:hypothetical protein